MTFDMILSSICTSSMISFTTLPVFIYWALGLLTFPLGVIVLWFLYQRRQKAWFQEAYNEQEILVQQQQVLLAEVDRLYREQAQAAVTDPITGLPNHRAVMSKIEEVVEDCQQTGNTCAVLFVDLDHFKQINDTWGHLAGDAILREAGSRLRRTLHPDDFVGRYGGEEFAIVLTNTDVNRARQDAERSRLTIAEFPYFWETDDTQVTIPITASIGVAVYKLHGETSEALIQSADRAMYQAKQTGRNRVSLADAEIASPQESLYNVVAKDGQVWMEGPCNRAVQALTAVATAHDQSTSVHGYRTMQLAEATARAVGLPDEQRHLILLAALLHDIGKIGIPDAILHKPGPLTDEEWAIIYRHPQIGCEILQQIGGIFEKISPMVLAHHERWDGEGYPAGLAQNAIPFGARIISIADSFDTMISHRVYHEALTIEQARTELQCCSGSRYDPHLVEVFLRVLDETGLATQDHAANVSGSAGAGYVEPSPRSGEYAPSSV